jgi:hypothetical protein
VEQNRTLDQWIGEGVRVHLVTGEGNREPQPINCMLWSADERGVLVDYWDTRDGGRKHCFFPWHRVERIEHSDAEAVVTDVRPGRAERPS